MNSRRPVNSDVGFLFLMNRFRFYFAALLAPLVVPVAALILSGMGRNSIGETYTVVMLFMLIAYLVAGFLGLPALLILRGLQIMNLAACLIVGAAIGLLTALFVHLVFYSDVPFADSIGALGYFAFWILTFTGSALAFWFVSFGFRLRLR